MRPQYVTHVNQATHLPWSGSPTSSGQNGEAPQARSPRGRSASDSTLPVTDIMNLMAGGFAAYQLLNVHTGVALYSTTATAQEIQQANQNLQHRGYNTRFVPIEPVNYSYPTLKAA